jgi:hypothetical protein
VRLRVWFVGASGQAFPRVGSGTLLPPRGQAVLAAGHVLTPTEGDSLVAVEVIGQGPTATHVVPAVAAACFRSSDPRRDCGLLSLVCEVDHAPGLDVATEADRVFDARLQGYPEGPMGLIDRGVRVRADDGLLVYDQNVGQSCMSGGPLREDTFVVGIHLGQPKGYATQVASSYVPALVDRLAAALNTLGKSENDVVA